MTVRLSKKLDDFVACKRLFMEQKSYCTSRFKVIFLQLCLLQLSIKVANDIYLIQANYSIPKIMKLVLYIGIEIMIGQISTVLLV